MRHRALIAFSIAGGTLILHAEYEAGPTWSLSRADRSRSHSLVVLTSSLSRSCFALFWVRRKTSPSRVLGRTYSFG